MKRIRLNTYILMLGCLIMTHCSKDKGNYSYTDVNALTILRSDGNELDGTDYDIRLGKELLIKPTVKGTLRDDSKLSLQYYWILDKDTVGTKEELYVNTDELGVGDKIGKLVVVDKETSLAQYASFRIRITSGISKGSFILTESEDFETTLVLRDLTANEDYIYMKQMAGGFELGKYPLGLEVSYSATSATNREYKRAVISTKEGANPIMVVDLKQFLPTLMYPRSGATLGGELLEPSYVWCNPRQLQTNNVNGITLIEGKCYNMASGLISNDVYAYDPLDYSFDESAVCPSLSLNGHYVAGFDKKNERIRIFGNSLKGGGMFNQNFDHLVDPQSTKGHSFVANAEMIIGTDLIWQFITKKGNEMFMHNVVTDLNIYPYQPQKVNTIASKLVPQMVDAVHFVFSGQFWYFAKGRTIYQCSRSGLDIVPYLTLPEDGSGDIVSWNFDIQAASNFTKMGIATYAPSSTKEYKGSYYVYNMVDKKFDQQDLNVIDKAVDVEIGL
ncbi:PKD-like family lipoprotein [Sphingobacterium yanglingense]|nr:PKD-like family lipoprotein [Sphingobacterium yanglingense]